MESLRNNAAAILAEIETNAIIPTSEIVAELLTGVGEISPEEILGG